jgi:uncharacterized protein with PIN domain
MIGKCPKCEKELVALKMENVVGNLESNPWDCVVYSCPFCLTVLSVGIDPETFKNDTIKEVVEALKKP